MLILVLIGKRTNRNWRFHKDLRMWLTKDTTLPEPIQISAEKEQGSYQFFDPKVWERVRVSIEELKRLEEKALRR